MTRLTIGVFLLFFSAFVMAQTAGAQTTEFTYQGQLQASALPASGNFDFEFLLFDAAAGGSQIGATIPRSGVAVAGGIFAVNLDFGSSFPGAGRFLEIRVKQAGGGAFTTLSPRQAITSSPYSVKSLNSDTSTNAVNAANATIATTAVNATNATNFTGSLAGDVTGTQAATTVARLQTRNVANTAPADGQVLKFNAANNRWQPDTDNISGGGGVTSVTASGPLASSGGVTPNISLGLVPTANIADAAVTDAKIVTVSGAKVTGAVANATNATTATTATTAVSFSGALSGDVTGTQNATSIAAGAVTTAKLADNSVTNAKIVDVAGSKISGLITTATIPGANVTGAVANATNATSANQLNGQPASFYQNATNINAGTLDTARIPVPLTLSGFSSSGISGGIIRGENIAPSDFSSGVFGVSTSLLNATLGVYGRSNSFGGIGVYGETPNGSYGVYGRNDAVGRTGVGGFANGPTGPTIGVSGVAVSPDGTGVQGLANSSSGTTYGVVGASSSTSGRGVFGRADSAFGVTYGVYGLSSSNSGIGVRGEVSAVTGFTFGVSGMTQSSDGTAVVGISTSNTGVTVGVRGGVFSQSGFAGFFTGPEGSKNYFERNVGIGTSAPTARLTVSGSGSFNAPGATRFDLVNSSAGIGYFQHVGDTGLWQLASGSTSILIVNPSGDVGIGAAPNRKLEVNGRARISSIPQEASFGQVCFTAAGDLVQCGASSLRWKTNLQSYSSGLDVIRRLRPISYTWKQSGAYDFGLGAEDVAKVDPSLAFTNSKGEVTGVKYEKMSLLLINAVKEQQTQIEVQERQNKAQQKQIEQQRAEIDALRALVCRKNKSAAVCKAAR